MTSLGVPTPAEASKAGWTAVEAMRATRGLPPHTLVNRIGSFILANERDIHHSEFLVVDGQPHLFDRLACELHPTYLRHAPFRVLLASRYGLLHTDPLTRGVTAVVESYTATSGRRVTGERFSYWDRSSQCLYLAHGPGHLYRLDGDTVHEEVNGAGPVVFLPVEHDVVQPDIGPHGELAAALVDDLQYATETGSGILSAADQRLLFLSWILACGFGNRLPAKPLLLMEGDHASGKTLALQRVQAALTGRTLPMTIGSKDEEDFPTMLLHETPIAIVDNQDTPIEWLRDAIATYTTAGGWRKRVFYTRTESLWIKPQAFIGITTRNPATYRRPDIADRCLLIRLAHRPVQGSPERILANILEKRSRLYGEWLWMLNRIVKLMRTTEVPENFPYRMVDFAQMVIFTARILGLDDSAAHTLLHAAQAERDELVLEDDPLLDLLDRWLASPLTHRVEITAQDLYDHLAMLAASAGQKFSYTPWSLSRRLRSLIAALRRRMVIQHRTVQGKTRWMFAPIAAANGHAAPIPELALPIPGTVDATIAGIVEA